MTATDQPATENQSNNKEKKTYSPLTRLRFAIGDAMRANKKAYAILKSLEEDMEYKKFEEEYKKSDEQRRQKAQEEQNQQQEEPTPEPKKDQEQKNELQM